MVIRNEERRKFAENLRYIAQHPPEWATSACAIAEVFDANYPLWKDSGELFDMLADLIDRPTCKNSEYLYDGSFFECSECGERWELTCGSPADNNLCFCPRCGAEVVS